jgi:hypothetical protein
MITDDHGDHALLETVLTVFTLEHEHGEHGPSRALDSAETTSYSIVVRNTPCDITSGV